MHPRTRYLADASDPAQQPLLQAADARPDDAPVLQSAAEPPLKPEKGSGAAAPSAPPLSSATTPGGPRTDQASASGYGLPSGYRAQYAGETCSIGAADHTSFSTQLEHTLTAIPILLSALSFACCRSTSGASVNQATSKCCAFCKPAHAAKPLHANLGQL